MSAFLKNLKLSKEILEAEEKKNEEIEMQKNENKIKVNYPLFVKKSKSNMFKRAGKADLNKMKEERKEKILRKRKMMKRTKKRGMHVIQGFFYTSFLPGVLKIPKINSFYKRFLDGKESQRRKKQKADAGEMEDYDPCNQNNNNQAHKKPIT